MKPFHRRAVFGLAAVFLCGLTVYAYEYSEAACELTGRFWNREKSRCINPDCRQKDTCGFHAGESRETCETIRPGDSLDKAWYVLGRPSQDEGGKLLWESKAAAKVAEIEPDGEKVGRIICY